MSTKDILKEHSLNNGQVIRLMLVLISVVSAISLVYFTFNQQQSDISSIKKDLIRLEALVGTQKVDSNGRMDRKAKQNKDAIDLIRTDVNKKHTTKPINP